MPDYKAYFIGRDGHFFNAKDLLCDSDEVAIEAAKQLVDGHDVELWQRHRKVAKLKPNR
ncbi:hypothetical protein V1291_005649 [Nitrobacteraceae bacterium AZCC 1564]